MIRRALIKPTSATDPDGIEVKEYNSSAWINAITVLGPAKLNVRSGYRDRFVVEAAKAAAKLAEPPAPATPDEAN